MDGALRRSYYSRAAFTVDVLYQTRAGDDTMRVGSN